MPDLALASSEYDAQAAQAIELHHTEMAGALALRTEALVDAAGRPDEDAAERARAALVEWCETALLPHARAEEDALYPAALRTTEARLLIIGMVAEHEAIGRLVREVAESASKPVRAAAAARALQAVFEAHLAKENELVVPLLVSRPDVSLTELLHGMHELLGETEHPEESTGCGGHSCSCGETDLPDFPELDARSIPHAVRHAAVFGALETVHPGGGLLLVAPHDPLPLLAQIEKRWPGGFTTEYVERGPEAWRLRLVRASA